MTSDSPNTPHLTALAERCEQATGPDRKLDREIELAVMPERVDPEPWETLAAYTASLDAAMTLVPEGCIVTIGGGLGIGTSAIEVSGRIFARKAATPALALCAAALRARSTDAR
jgi:hypothetical protein